MFETGIPCFPYSSCLEEYSLQKRNILLILFLDNAFQVQRKRADANNSDEKKKKKKKKKKAGLMAEQKKRSEAFLCRNRFSCCNLSVFFVSVVSNVHILFEALFGGVFLTERRR